MLLPSGSVFPVMMTGGRLEGGSVQMKEHRTREGANSKLLHYSGIVEVAKAVKGP